MPKSRNITISAEKILESLVGFDTTSHKSNLEIIEYIEGFLESYGIESKRIPNETGDKENLFATIGPKDRAGIGLSGHTDVVPVTDQNWSTDPFALTEKNNLLYGRGTCDMKGFLACMLAAVPEFTNNELNIPIHLIFSYDEEIGCVGVRPMIEKFGKDIIKPKMIIVGEPTDMKVVNAHKGTQRYITEVTGFEAHSSVSHKGVNAIMIAAQLITKLSELRLELIENQNEPRFSPPYTSIHVGKIAGGTALNIVPKACQFIWEMRHLPSHDPQEILKKFNDFANLELLPNMQEIAPEADIKTTHKNTVHAFQTAQNEVGEDLTSLVMNWAGQNRIYAESYGTEAGFFEKGGCPSIICGPGSVAQAHKPDEYVSRDQLQKCMQFMRGITEYAAN